MNSYKKLFIAFFALTGMATYTMETSNTNAYTVETNNGYLYKWIAIFKTSRNQVKNNIQTNHHSAATVATTLSAEQQKRSRFHWVPTLA